MPAAILAAHEARRPRLVPPSRRRTRLPPERLLRPTRRRRPRGSRRRQPRPRLGFPALGRQARPARPDHAVHGRRVRPSRPQGRAPVRRHQQHRRHGRRHPDDRPGQVGSVDMVGVRSDGQDCMETVSLADALVDPRGWDRPPENVRRNCDYPAIMDAEGVNREGLAAFRMLAETHGRVPQPGHRPDAGRVGGPRDPAQDPAGRGPGPPRLPLPAGPVEGQQDARQGRPAGGCGDREAAGKPRQPADRPGLRRVAAPPNTGDDHIHQNKEGP